MVLVPRERLKLMTDHETENEIQVSPEDQIAQLRKERYRWHQWATRILGFEDSDLPEDSFSFLHPYLDEKIDRLRDRVIQLETQVKVLGSSARTLNGILQIAGLGETENAATYESGYAACELEVIEHVKTAWTAAEKTAEGSDDDFLNGRLGMAGRLLGELLEGKHRGAKFKKGVSQ